MAAPKIEKLLTPYNFTNKDSVGRIKYIVIHYVGALGGAKANCQYYASKYIGASAHYFVGFDGEIWQSVPDEDIAWHCGASSYKHAECRNANSIGIELCVRNKGSQADTSKDWYFEDATVKAAIELTKYLMQKYGVPASHVIRHYDVTGKICPNPYVYNTTKHTWDAFKKAIMSSYLEQRVAHNYKTNNIVNFVVREIINSQGCIAIKELEDKTGYTGRYLRKMVKDLLGISIKQFCEVIKFQWMCNYYKLRQGDVTLSDLALQSGYYDQSHMNLSCKKLTGELPKKIINMYS